MKLAEQMPTLTRWYQRCAQRLAAIPREPYIAFLVACVIATAIVPVSLTLDGADFTSILVFPLLVPLWLPVVSGDLALIYWSERVPAPTVVDLASSYSDSDYGGSLLHQSLCQSACETTSLADQ